MLTIRIAKSGDDIKLLQISKHAVKQSQDDEMYSLICAGVSSISIGLCNAVDIMANESCEIVVNESEEDNLNHITIRVVKNSSTLQNILNTGVIQLKTVYEGNENYIDLKFTEV